MNRRALLQAIPAAGLLAPLGANPAIKKKLAKHRNLFNGDSCTYFYNPEFLQPEGLPYTAKAVHRYVDLLADNGVDTFLINPNAQKAWYPSKKLETIIDGYKRGDRDFFRGHAVAANVPASGLDAYLDHMVKFFNLYLDLADAGVDWLAETSKACRRRKIAPWVSVRMNDMHGAGNPKGSNFNVKLFKDPQYRLSGRAFDPKDGNHNGWAALNYEKQEVRDFMLSHVREYLEDYDFDGMELDWLRNPHCCEPVAGAKQIDMMLGWFGEVRRLTEARARKIGKPVPLGMRVPPNLGYLKSIGIDLPAAVRAGLIDFIGFSNFWQTSWTLPYDELRAQVGNDVVIYGVVEDAPNWVPGFAPGLSGPVQRTNLRYMAASAPMQRANAAGKLAMGVDGIEQFNFFCTDQNRVPGLRCDYSVLRNTHDLEFLRGKPKHYCLESPTTWLSRGFEMPESIPVRIEANSRREFRLSMCAEPKPMKLTVQVVVPKGDREPRIGVSVNGCWPVFDKKSTQAMLFPVGPYTEHVPETQAYNFEFDSGLIREGWNRVLVLNNNKPGGDAGEPVTVMSLELGVNA